MNLLERANAFLAEASIDAVTPRVYRAASKAARNYFRKPSGSTPEYAYRSMLSRLRKGKPLKVREIGSFVQKHPITGRKLRTSIGHASVESNPVQAFLHPRVGRHSNTIGLDPILQHTPQPMLKSLIGHELVHATDPRMTGAVRRKASSLRKRGLFAGGAVAFPKRMPDDMTQVMQHYYLRPTEQHAYGAIAGRLGMRGLKRAGVGGNYVRKLLRTGVGKRDTEKMSKRMFHLAMHASEEGKKGQAGMEALASLGPVAAYNQLSRESRAGKKAWRKLSKELYKGYERAYRPKIRPRLPEAIEEMGVGMQWGAPAPPDSKTRLKKLYRELGGTSSRSKFLTRFVDDVHTRPRRLRESAERAVANSARRRELIHGALQGDRSTQHRDTLVRSLMYQLRREDRLVRNAKKQASKRARQKWEPVQKPYGLRRRLEGVGLRKDARGFFVHTHRARSHSYPSPEKIPLSKIRFIRSTG